MGEGGKGGKKKKKNSIFSKMLDNFGWAGYSAIDVFSITVSVSRPTFALHME